MSVRSPYVRQRPDESRRSVIQCGMLDQRRVKCISVAAFLELFCSSFSLSTLCAECESTGTNVDSAVYGRDGMDWQRRKTIRADGLLGTTLCR
jgi:hypothetical protein